MRSAVDRNVVMRHILVLGEKKSQCQETTPQYSLNMGLRGSRVRSRRFGKEETTL